MQRKPHNLAAAGAAAIAIAVLAVASVIDASLVLFNHSSSIPEGFYLRTTGAVQRGRFVTVRGKRRCARGGARSPL
jgi:type IV secretory pathway protease TraF